VARFLPTELASLGFVAISVGAAARASLESGTTQILVSSEKVDSELIATSYHLEVLKGCVLASVLFAASATVYLWPVNGVPWEAVAMGALVPLSMAFINPAYRLWERSGEHRRVVLVTTIGNVVGLASLALLFILGAGWWSIPLSIAVGQGVTTLLSHLRGDPIPRDRPRFAALRDLFLRGSPFVLSGMAAYFSTLGVDLLLALFGAVTWVAPYRLSMALVHTVLSAIPAVLARASLSEEAAKVRRGGALPAPDRRTVMLVAASTALLVPVCYVMLPKVALFLYGGAWEGTSEVVPPLCALVGLKALSTPLSTLFVAGRRYWTEARVNLAEAGLGAIAVGALAQVSIAAGIWVATGISILALIARKSLLAHCGAQRFFEGTLNIVVACLAVFLLPLASTTLGNSVLLAGFGIPFAAGIVLAWLRQRT
jgi:O-antigen/teichoic acid export membrane protein